MKFIKDAEWNRLKRMERAYGRMGEAHRWLSEWDSWLSPMWDYLFGKKESFILSNGNELMLEAAGDINQQREKMRDRLRKHRAYIHFEVEAKAYEEIAKTIEERFGEPKIADFLREKAAADRKAASELLEKIGES